MKFIAFNKYQGTGNDFIIIDNRGGDFNPDDNELVKKICDRKFGVGADGLILIGASGDYDFEMKYFNSDGFESTMCGNGGRCAADYAIRNHIAPDKMSFMAIDGIHNAVSENGVIQLKMNDVTEIRKIQGNYFLNTGSPHYVVFTSGLDNLDVFTEGRKIRNSHNFLPGGTNVNFIEITPESLFVRTYERGVEDETLSCGTGVTASAIASVVAGHFGRIPVPVETRGGKLSVEFTTEGNEIKNIWLCGPATFVFEGRIEI